MRNENTLSRVLFFAFISLFILESSAFAAVPVVANNFINVFVDLAKGNMGIIFIILVLAMSGFMAWRNGNMTPMFWGLAASLLIGGAPFIAPRLISFGQNTF